MAPRRKAPRRRPKRSFSVNLLETGAGLAFLDAANAGTAAQSFLKGDLKGSKVLGAIGPLKLRA